MALHLDPGDQRRQRHLPSQGIEAEELRPSDAAATLASGSMICPDCELPIAVDSSLPAISDLVCPYCDHAAEARAFLRENVRDTRSNRVDLVARLT